MLSFVFATIPESFSLRKKLAAEWVKIAKSG